MTSNNLVLRTLCNMDSDQFELLQGFVSPIVDDDNAEVGWEELTVASTAHLLRTCLSKKNANNSTNNTQIDKLDNTEKLKRQLQAVYERIRTGGVLTF